MVVKALALRLLGKHECTRPVSRMTLGSPIPFTHTHRALCLLKPLPCHSSSSRCLFIFMTFEISLKRLTWVFVVSLAPETMGEEGKKKKRKRERETRKGGTRVFHSLENLIREEKKNDQSGDVGELLHGITWIINKLNRPV